MWENIIILFILGTIMLVGNDGEKIYDITVDHQLFGLTKLDITVSYWISSKYTAVCTCIIILAV